MKFKEWMRSLEEGIQRGKQTTGNQDMTRGLGPTSQYGQSAMMPISFGIDNRAVAGVIDGIGDARADIRARKGAEPGAASQYHMWQDVRKDGITTIYMPLQRPAEDSRFNRSPIVNSKSLVQSLKSSGDPLENDEVWKVDKANMRIVGQPIGRNQNRLYLLEKGSEGDHQEFSDAKEFTTALMFASIAFKLEKYSHVLNIERPRIKDSRFEQVPFGKSENGKEMFYVVMMCSFILTSKHKDQEIDGELRDEIERVLSGDKNAPPPPRGQNDARQPRPNKSRFNSSRRPGAGPRRPQISMGGGGA